MTDRRPSAFHALAHAHLRTPAERAVFAIVAGAGDRWWTAAGIARAANVGELEADQALRRFGAAGIVEHRGVDAGHRYRYQAEMAYLHTGGGIQVPDEIRDPVCGMPVAADTPHLADDEGRIVRFCSIPCLSRWRRARRTGRLW